MGANPGTPAAFVSKLLAKDKGWLMAYFDVLSRVNARQQAYFVNARRLRPFYEGLRAPDPTVAATRGTFRPAPTLLLLATRLQLESNGEPLTPGNIEVWKDLFLAGHNMKLARKWKTNISSSDQLVQIMFALSRGSSENGALQVYLAISELDSRRSPEHRLAPTTVQLLAQKFEEYSDQYRIFESSRNCSDGSDCALFASSAKPEEHARSCAWERLWDLSGQRRDLADPGAPRRDCGNEHQRVVAGDDKAICDDSNGRAVV